MPGQGSAALSALQAGSPFFGMPFNPFGMPPSWLLNNLGTPIPVPGSGAGSTCETPTPNSSSFASTLLSMACNTAAASIAPATSPDAGKVKPEASPSGGSVGRVTPVSGQPGVTLHAFSHGGTVEASNTSGTHAPTAPATYSAAHSAPRTSGATYATTMRYPVSTAAPPPVPAMQGVVPASYPRPPHTTMTAAPTTVFHDAPVANRSRGPLPILPSTTPGAKLITGISKPVHIAGSAPSFPLVLATSAAGKPLLFKCRYCTYSSKASASVVVHERRHTGEKPFKCRYDCVPPVVPAMVPLCGFCAVIPAARWPSCLDLHLPRVGFVVSV